jgi:hypothetical protein
MPTYFRANKKYLEYTGTKGMIKTVGEPFDSHSQAKACLKAIPKDYDIENLDQDNELLQEFKTWFAWYRERIEEEKEPVYVAWIEVPISGTQKKRVPYGLEIVSLGYGMYKTEQKVSNPGTNNMAGYKGASIEYVKPREELYLTERKQVWRSSYSVWGDNGRYVEIDEPVRDENGKIIEKATGLPFPEYSPQVAWSHYKPSMTCPQVMTEFTLYAVFELSSGYRVALLPRKEIKAFLKEFATWELLEDTGKQRTYKKGTQTMTLKHRVEIECTNN